WLWAVIRRTRSVPPRGTCRPADRRVAPHPSRSRSRRTTDAPPARDATSRAVMHPRIPAPTTATSAVSGATARPLLDPARPAAPRPLDERRELRRAADPTQAVDDPLAAPGDEAQVHVGEAALLARRVEHEDPAVGRAVPAHGEVLVDPELVAL